jgi:hypothetical protein
VANSSDSGNTGNATCLHVLYVYSMFRALDFVHGLCKPERHCIKSDLGFFLSSSYGSNPPPPTPQLSTPSLPLSLLSFFSLCCSESLPMQADAGWEWSHRRRQQKSLRPFQKCCFFDVDTMKYCRTNFSIIFLNYSAWSNGQQYILRLLFQAHNVIVNRTCTIMVYNVHGH